MPLISSIFFPKTGTLLKPCSMTMLAAVSMVSLLDTAVISGRGTMTSWTTVSPNSITCSISTRSSSSMASLAAASSANANSSSSDTSPSEAPFGMLAPIRVTIPLATHLSGGIEESILTSGAAIMALRSGWASAQLLGSASATA